jgi:hypothetical protein
MKVNLLKPARPVLARAPTTTSAMSLQRKCACGGGSLECDKCKKSKVLQRKTAGAVQAAEIPPIVQDVLGSPGQPLDGATRSVMETRFRHDFSQVRIHADAAAARSADAIAANAYTMGNNVVFNQGGYAPNSGNGQKLLAHELAHVVQQSRGGLPPGIDGDPALENEADRIANEIARPGAAISVDQASGVGIARDAKPGEEVYYEVTFGGETKRYTAAEYEAQKQQAIRRLRLRLKLVAELADTGRQSQIDMLKEYQGGVESLSDVFWKPKALIGIISDMKGEVTPPYLGMWNIVKSFSAEGLAACDQGELAKAARRLKVADESYRESMEKWNAYREATIGGAEGVASNLETVRDVSFAIALVAGAVVAAPIVAGAVGVGGLGLTGVTATGASALGTAGVVGAGGAILGGGSTAVASYVNTGKVDTKAAWRDAKKFGKQGAVTGLTVGLGSALGAAGKAAQIGTPLVQQALKRCFTEASVNVAGEITSATLDKVLLADTPEGNETGPKAILSGPMRAALTGCVTGVIGVPISRVAPGLVRKGAELAVGAGVGYADARLAGQDHDQALAAAAQGAVTHVAIQHGRQRNERPPGAKPRKTPSKPAEPHPAEGAEPSQPAVAKKPAAKGKGKTAADTAPAVRKEDALAKKATGDGHDAVVTKQGVARCSPAPCPAIHIEYAKELGQHPRLKEWNEKIQAMRETNPTQAAKEAAALIRTLDAARANAAKGAVHPGAEPERDFTLHVGEKRAEQIRTGEKNFAIDRALTFDIDEVLPVGAADIKPQRAVARARDAYNRQLLDPNTNQRTKKLGVDMRELRRNRGESPPVSVTKDPNVLITKRFSEVVELKHIFDRAVASVKEPQRLTPTEYKAAINRETRRIITEDPGPDAVAVRKALADLGFERQAGRGFTMTTEPPP